MLLTEKYAPNTLNQLIGNQQSVNRLLEFGLEAQQKKTSKPLLIYGPPGTGKTSAVHALAYSNGFELLELNASDYRDSETLSRTLLPATTSSGLFNKKLLILLDEIDERSDKFDSGSEQVITQVAKKSRHPVIFIANDFWSRKISFLRDIVEKVEFKKVGKDEILTHMSEILKRERKKLDPALLQELATRSNGDVRGALNDLEMMIDAKPELMESLGVRDKKVEIFGVLDKIFGSRNFEIAKNANASTDLDTSMLMNWIDQNIPNRYSDAGDIANAYLNVARASFFINQAARKNYYSYLRYSSILMSSGVALSGSGIGYGYAKSYSFPESIRQLSKTKSSRSDLSKVLTKLIYVLHIHKKNVFSEYLYMLKDMINDGMKECGEEQTLEFFDRYYKLDKNNVETISKLT